MALQKKLVSKSAFSPAKKPVAKPAAPAKKPVAKKPVAKPATKPVPKKPVAKKVVAPVKKPVAKKAVAPAKRAASAAPGLKPITEALNKSQLTAKLAEVSGQEPKTVKQVMGALEQIISASVHKKGSGVFVLPGFVKIMAIDVPAKPKRFGKDPFTGEERWFPAKPATVKIKARPLAKVKQAAM